MNSQQQKAIAALKRGLTMCHNAGLMGGVFESNFCVWPNGKNPHEGDRFFDNIEEFGAFVDTDMNLDGGAGV